MLLFITKKVKLIGAPNSVTELLNTINARNLYLYLFRVTEKIGFCSNKYVDLTKHHASLERLNSVTVAVSDQKLVTRFILTGIAASDK
jgi:hypothetical protein